MRRIIAVDPGKTTGWALLVIPLEREWENGEWRKGLDRFECGEMSWFGWLEWFDNYMEVETPFATDVIIEDFIYTKETLKKSRQSWSTEAIGVMKYLCLKHNVPTPVLQSAATAKSFATREKLEKMGWWVPGSDHAQDAARHLLTWCVANDKVDLERLL